MRFKVALKYQLYDKRFSLLIFYFIIYCIIALLIYVDRKSTGAASFAGLDVASTIFIFVMALASCKETLMLFLQNGVSRRTFFMGFLIVLAAVSLLMSVIDNINTLIFSHIISYESLFMQIYQVDNAASLMPLAFTAICWSFAFNFLSGSFGLFIGSLYFRMNKWQKIVVSIGAPVFFFIVLPIFLSQFPDLAVYRFFIRLLIIACGADGYHPFNFVASSLLLGAIIAFFSFLLIKKAPAKE